MPIDPPYSTNIAADIRRQIASGQLKPGDRLGTIAELTAHYGRSQGVVRRALEWLKLSGELVSHQGVGYFVSKTVEPDSLDGSTAAGRDE